MARPRLMLLAPIGPAPSGNGLAMRCELFRRAAALDFDVETVVVPVAGRTGHAGAAAGGGAAGAIEVTPDGARARAGLRSLLAEPAWRDRMARVGRLPRGARAASPGLAEVVAQSLRGRSFDALHVMRAYMAPLGVALAERLEVAARTLDLDDDDAAVFASVYRDRAGALAFARLIDVFGGPYGSVCAASPVDARAIANRHGLEVEYVPNAVEVPRTTRSHARAAELRLLFVGNLTYAPNADAARALVGEVMPRVRARLGERPLRLTLAGRARSDVEGLASSSVRVLGFVEDLEPLYAEADAVVVPLGAGGGTRIKLLEAFARGVPVVATPAAAEGLAVADGRHLLVRGDADGLAGAVTALAADVALAAHLAEQARQLVRERYSLEAVMPRVSAFLAGAARGAGVRQPSGRS